MVFIWGRRCLYGVLVAGAVWLLRGCGYKGWCAVVKSGGLMCVFDSVWFWNDLYRLCIRKKAV